MRRMDSGPGFPSSLSASLKKFNIMRIFF
jgi:hypothetical protein